MATTCVWPGCGATVTGGGNYCGNHPSDSDPIRKYYEDSNAADVDNTHEQGGGEVDGGDYGTDSHDDDVADAF